MLEVIIARHGESVATSHGVQNGDPRTDAGLTPTGEEQARVLGRLLVDDPIELCVTSLFPRTQQTAHIALQSRSVPFCALAGLDDIRYGEFEGKPKAEYHAWALHHDLSARIPGGESRIEVAGRMCEAMAEILDRSERVALVVTHELLISDLMAATAGDPPPAVHLAIPYATPYRFLVPDVARRIVVMRGWTRL